MTGRKRRLFLMLGVCVAFVVAWLLSTRSRPEPGEGSRAGFTRIPHKESSSPSVSSPPTDELRYRITHKSPHVDPGVVKADRSIQFTFPGDSTISPGSLARMTGLMHSGEIEIATKLARDIKFPAPP